MILFVLFALALSLEPIKVISQAESGKASHTAKPNDHWANLPEGGGKIKFFSDFFFFFFFFFFVAQATTAWVPITDLCSRAK